MFRGRAAFCVSLRRLKAHEFNKTIRYIHKSGNWAELYQKLSELQGQATANLLKTIGPLIISYLILVSLNADGKVSISIQGISASIPTAYFSISVSFIFFLSTLALAHLSTVFFLRSRASGKILLPGFSTSIFGLLSGYDENALSVPILNNWFLKELIPVYKVLTIFFVIALFGILVPYFAFAFYLITTQVELVQMSSTTIYEKTSGIFGIGLVSLSLAYFILFHLPLPMVKNKRQIRWNFLSVISTKFPHPQTKKWLEEKE